MVARKKRKASKLKQGKAPGALIYTGEHFEPTSLRLVEFNADTINYSTPESSSLVSNIDGEKNSWISVYGLNQPELIKKIGEQFRLHHLLLEDCINSAQYPKYESFPNCLFLTFKSLSGCDDLSQPPVMEHISIVLGKGWLIHMQESKEGFFSNLDKRLKAKAGKIRTEPVDYLFYTLLDTIVDLYLVQMDHLEEQLELIEENLSGSSGEDFAKRISSFRQHLLQLSRIISPLESALRSLLLEEHELLRPGTYRYLRDVQDHLLQVQGQLEGLRESVANIWNLHLSLLSNQMNAVMKRLTLVATIFIPLTFLVGIWGMNFEHMPELGWKYGYLAAWGLMAIVGFITWLLLVRKSR